MTKAKTAPDFLARRQFAMNPASVVWPAQAGGDEAVTKTAMRPRRARDDDQPVTVLNRDWKPA